MRVRRIATWVALNLALWLGATVAFGAWLDREVQEEYRLGYRTAAEGDTIMIPIVGFATDVGAALVALNLVVLAVRAVRRRRSRPVT